MAKSSAQSFLEVDQIREGIIILKNNSLRGVIMTSSVNFALLSGQRQKAIISQFQDFLNSLDFSIQIVVQSRKLNLTGYLEKLEELQRNAEKELMQVQIAEYRKFISNLIEEQTIMTKDFLVLVPFDIHNVPGKEITKNKFERSKSQLWQRMEFTVLGLRRCGLDCGVLQTPELIELFWTLHHQKKAEVGYYPEIPSELII